MLVQYLYAVISTITKVKVKMERILSITLGTVYFRVRVIIKFILTSVIILIATALKRRLSTSKFFMDIITTEFSFAGATLFRTDTVQCMTVH